jgi:hypothetical protein
MADKTNYLVSHFSLYRATAYAVFESTWFYLLNGSYGTRCRPPKNGVKSNDFAPFLFKINHFLNCTPKLPQKIKSL